MNEIVETEARPASRALETIDTSPSALLRLAVQSGASLDQLERFMALQERHEAMEAKKAGVAAMSGFKAEPLTIFKRKEVGYKTKEGDFVGYKHAELSDVTDAVVPAMAKHGLSHRWDVVQRDGKVIVTCIVTHAMGHSESVTMEAPPDTSGKKNTIQAIASTVSYLQRYTLLAVTGMATTGMDDDGHGSDGEGKRQRGIDIERMCADIVALFQEGREMDALSIWQNPESWAKDTEEAMEERKYAWQFVHVPKLHAFLQANDRKRT